MARDTTSEFNSEQGSGLSLAERLREGSADAWSELVLLYGPLVDQWCRSAGASPDAIPDIAQEVFLTAFRGLKGFDSQQSGASFRGWLWTIARSRVMDHHRKTNQQCAARGGSSAMLQIQTIADPLPLEEPTEPDQAAALLNRALNQIRAEFTAQTWDYFWRSTVLGHPTDLIARENQVSSAAIRQAKSRVLRRLRKQLGDA